jgi:hypothetical protein
MTNPTLSINGIGAAPVPPSRCQQNRARTRYRGIGLLAKSDNHRSHGGFGNPVFPVT